uniref:Nipped-B protein n=1 Tax=Callorhinchus milii TaxID=7868 RepID=A0A4W3HIU6_CALMI
MRNKADQQLVEIDKKYTGFVHMKAVAGMKMSYQLQQSIHCGTNEMIRGFRQEESVSALCSHLYSMVRGNRQHRRAFLIALLNLFDDSAVSETFLRLGVWRARGGHRGEGVRLRDWEREEPGEGEGEGEREEASERETGAW